MLFGRRTHPRFHGLIVLPALAALAFTSLSSSNAEANMNPPEFGFLDLDLGINLHAPRDLAVREESMCEGWARAWVIWDEWSNRVDVFGLYDGLPYRPTLCHPYDVSTDYNDYPVCVEEGVWQGWLVGRMFTRTSTFYYDEGSGTLLGNEFDFESVPEDSVEVEMPVAQMVCTETFESDPNTLFAWNWASFDYDQILDNEGTGGTLYAVLPTNLYDPTSLDTWYLVGGLPPEEAMSWDDVVADLDEGVGGILYALSYEPDPKPPYLLGTDNVMTGWGAVYPQGAIPETPAPSECGTFQVPPL